MPDDSTRAADKIHAALANGKPTPAKVTVDRLELRRRTGFRFQKGDAVIELLNGKPATVVDMRPAGRVVDPMYVLRLADGTETVRIERELELDPAPPTTRGA